MPCGWAAYAWNHFGVPKVTDVIMKYLHIPKMIENFVKRRTMPVMTKVVLAGLWETHSPAAPDAHGLWETHSPAAPDAHAPDAHGAAWKWCLQGCGRRILLQRLMRMGCGRRIRLQRLLILY
ncbi:hypothetical protein CYMTET_40454 [Cymbomonas tetramitiformis]|uniref:Uncharacterized protein n=1 Tax=Cymbomonas tetramitiformis TaxID=36881 RepID=A0AAE0C9A2_9CHLO|nr:hypothetical protein CYMTET_40454 [Cymbomonas tetramitiformis]